MSFRYGALILLLVSPLLAAGQEMVLTARPGLCILQDPDTVECIVGVELTWQAPSGDYCLYLSGSPLALQCWQGAVAGTHRTRLASREDVSYWMQAGSESERLAEIVVRVLSLAQRNPERRRRRHAWTPL